MPRGIELQTLCNEVALELAHVTVPPAEGAHSSADEHAAPRGKLPVQIRSQAATAGLPAGSVLLHEVYAVSMA